MIVAMSRRIAAELYAAIVALRPDWHDNDLSKGKIKVVMTAASSDGPRCPSTTAPRSSAAPWPSA
jgi:type I restriction enzyme R subunit